MGRWGAGADALKGARQRKPLQGATGASARLRAAVQRPGSESSKCRPSLAPGGAEVSGQQAEAVREQAREEAHHRVRSLEECCLPGAFRCRMGMEV